MRRSGVVVAAVLVLLGGCGSTEDGVAGRTADRFVTDVATGDGAAACAALTEQARQAVESFGRDCARTVVGLQPAGRIGTVEVWGDGAQVRFEHDVVFLSRFPDGWKVRAAGCRPRAGAPYDCMLAG